MALGATVELLNTIPDVVLAGNKVPLQFQASQNYIVSAGTKAQIILTWTAVALANEYFDLLLNCETVRFTCKAAPDNSGIQFHDNSGALTLANWVALLATDLAKNYLISRYYDLTVGGTSIELTAKEVGSDYSQEFTAGAGIDCTADEANKTGTDKTHEDFYYINILLYCNDELVTELLLNVDEDGLAETDIADLLKPYIIQEFKWPENDYLFMFLREDAVAEWYFKYGERWGDEDNTALQTSDTYYAINGGISWMQRARYNEANSNFWADLLAHKYFLSWAPLIKYVSADEIIKLYFINHSAASYLRLKARLYHSTTENLINTLTNVTYETFQYLGTTISSAINAISTGQAWSVETFAITDGEKIHVDISISNQSGELPYIQLIRASDGMSMSDPHHLSLSDTEVILTASATCSAAKLRIYNSAASSFRSSEIIVHRAPMEVEGITGIDKNMYECVLSPALVDYLGLDDESLEKVEVWLEDESEAIVSEVRTFIFDYSHYEHTRYFIFKNSLGAFESLRTTGLVEKKEEYTRETASIDNNSDFTTLDREELSVMNSSQQKYTVSLGWLNRYAEMNEYRNWLNDFLLSKEIYLVSGDILIPVRLTGNNFDKWKDRDNMAGLTFEFVYAFTDEFFTKGSDED
jgi:hypothetical protein